MAVATPLSSPTQPPASDVASRSLLGDHHDAVLRAQEIYIQLDKECNAAKLALADAESKLHRAAKVRRVEIRAEAAQKRKALDTLLGGSALLLLSKAPRTA